MNQKCINSQDIFDVRRIPNHFRFTVPDFWTVFVSLGGSEESAHRNVSSRGANISGAGGTGGECCTEREGTA